MAIFPGAIATDADLYIAVNNLSTLLTDNPLTIGATTVNVISTTGFPTVGFISIGAEIIKYTGKTATSFTGCTRGADGTSAAAHALNDQVDHNVIAAHHNAPKDEIIAIETFLNTKFGTSGAAFTVSRAIQTNPTTGILEVSSVTNTELGYVAGVTSPIQTQLDTKAVDTFVVHLAGTETITGSKTFSSLLNANAGVFGAASISGAGLVFTAQNTSNTANSDAVFRAIVGGASAGDAFTRYDISGGQSFAAGLDTSEGTYKISASSTLGTSDVIKMTSSQMTALVGLAMSSNKITGLAGATANGDAVRFEQLQVRQIQIGSTSTPATTTSTSFTDTNLSVTITPTSTSSRILLMVFQNCGGILTVASNVVEVDLQLLRGAGVIFGPLSVMEFDTLANGSQINSTCAFTYIDSPATTSATTYKTQFARGNSSNGITHNVQTASGGTSFLVAVEIGA